MRVCRFILCVSLCLYAVELKWNVLRKEKILSPLSTIISKSGSLNFILAFQQHTETTALIMNNLQQIARTDRKNLKLQGTRNTLLPLLLLISIGIPVIFIIGAPLITLTFPGRYHAFYSEFLGTVNLQNYFWRTTLLITESMLMLPGGFIIPTVFCSTLVILKYLQLKLRLLTSDLMKSICGNDTKESWYRIGVVYREIQVFNLCCSEAFEYYVWGHPVSRWSRSHFNYVLPNYFLS